MKQTYRANLPDLPALPALSVLTTATPEVCSIIALYLAVWNDLTSEQQHMVASHVQICAYCTTEQQRLHTVTHLMQHMHESSPSARVDQAVAAAIALRSHNGVYSTGRRSNGPFSGRMHASVNVAFSWRVTILVAAAAVVLLTVVTTVRFMKDSPGPSSQAFLLPATLTWAGFVLYHSETRMGKNGQSYVVIAYHNMHDGHIHVETVQQGMLDVVAMSDQHETLGLDMMHHIAQWGADSWLVDESIFNLGTLQHELRVNHTMYLGMMQFHGVSVYRIRLDDGLVLLLDKQYMPVNVLRGVSNSGSGVGEPLYDTLRMLKPAQVSSTMWDMHVPAGFTMGALPAKP